MDLIYPEGKHRSLVRLIPEEPIPLSLFVVYEPGLNTPRISQVLVRRLHVHLFSITLPRRQTHSDFRGRFCLLFPKMKVVRLFKELINATDNPHITNNYA